MALTELCLCWLTLCTAFCHVTDRAHILVRDSLHSQSPIALTSDFWTLATTSSMFADKSNFISDVMANPSKVVIVTRPPKWGKSINLSMLKYFFDLQSNSNGDRIPFPVQRNYQFFRHGKIMEGGTPVAKLDPLHVCFDVAFVYQYCGRHPVIYLNCTGVTGNTLDELFTEFRMRVSTIYHRYEFLKRVFAAALNSTITTLFEKQRALENLRKFESLLEGKSRTMHLSESVLFISETLHSFYGMSVVVLVDDYDVPISSAIMSNMSKEDKDTFAKFYDHFVTNSFKSNKYIRKSVLTGILPLFGTERFHVSTGASRYTMCEEEFAEHFGFTPDELSRFFKLMSIQYSMQERLRLSHKGYYFGTHSNLTMYNPSAMAHFFHTSHLHHHTLSGKFVEENLFSSLRVILFREKIAGFLYEIESPVLKSDLEITTRGLTALHDAVQLPLNNINAKYFTDNMLAYMYHYGYLSSTSPLERSPNKLSQVWRLPRQPEYVYLRWATKKIAEVMRKKMLTYYSSKLNITEFDPPIELIRNFKKFVSARFQNNSTLLGQELQSFLRNMSGEAVLRKESTHFLFNYLALQMDTYYAFVDEFNPRKPDFMLLKDDYLVIMEFTLNRLEAIVSPSRYDVVIRKLAGTLKNVKYVVINYTPNLEIQISTQHRTI